MAPAGAQPKVGEGPVVICHDARKARPAPFKGAPAAALWTSAEAEKDGLKITNLMEGDKMYVSMRFVDRNLPKMKEFIGKSVHERADYQYCFETPAADAPKIKTYPAWTRRTARTSSSRSVTW